MISLTTKPAPAIDYKYAAALLENLKNLAWEPTGPERGMRCYGYSDQEQQAIDLVVTEAKRLGMQPFQDHAGNVYLFKKGTDVGHKARMMVSHLDTVPSGGAHDGRDGIVAGLTIVKALADARMTLAHDICIMIARSEESAVNGTFSLGAKLATGQITAAELARMNDIEGRPVVNKITACGLNHDQLFNNAPLIPGRGSPPSKLVDSVLEIHIEQGQYCAKNKADLCVVTAIRGNTRFQGCSSNSNDHDTALPNSSVSVHNQPGHGRTITIIGEAAHSGATFEEDRADAVRTAIALFQAAEQWCAERRQSGMQDIRLVPRSLSTPNRSITTISNEATLGFTLHATAGAAREFDAWLGTWASQRSEHNNKLKFTFPPSEPQDSAATQDNSAPLSSAVRSYLTLMSAAETWFQKQREAGRDIVFTPSVVYPHESGRHLSFSFEIRSTDPAILADFSTFIEGCNSDILSGAVSLPKASITEPVTMDPKLVTFLQQQLSKVQIAQTASGAGHDASTLAQAGYPTVMIFIKQPAPISHNPDEAHDAGSFEEACRLGMWLMAAPTKTADAIGLSDDKNVSSLRDFIVARGAISL